MIQSDLIDTELELVIPKDPREMLDAGEFLHIPIMYGTVRDEGSLVVGCKLPPLHSSPNLYSTYVFVCMAVHKNALFLWGCCCSLGKSEEDY